MLQVLNADICPWSLLLQKWDANDYRLSRFVDRPKHVNPNFAINLIDEVPPKACVERVVCCDGGSGPTGHPKVYINLVRRFFLYSIFL